MPEQLQGYRLSPQQRRVWTIGHESAAYRVMGKVLIRGRLNIEHLQSALHTIIHRHEILRTTFHHRPGIKVPIQVIHNTLMPIWHTINLCLYSSDDQARDLEVLIQTEQSYIFDTEKNSPIRISLIILSDESYVLLLNISALCADTQTLINLVQELSNQYATVSSSSDVYDDIVQYVQFSEWQNELLQDEEAEGGNSYWQQILSTHFIAALPFESSLASQHSSNVSVVKVDVAPDIQSQLRGVAESCQASLKEVLLAGWQILLWQQIGQSELAIASVSHGRKYDELQSALGLFAKTIPIKIHIDPHLRFVDLVTQIHRNLYHAERWQEYFVWMSNGDEYEQKIDFAFEFCHSISEHTVDNIIFILDNIYSCVDYFKLKLQIIATDKEMSFSIYHNSSSLDKKYVQYLADQYMILLGNVARDQKRPISRISLLSAPERKRLVADFNDTVNRFEEEHFLRIFRQQVLNAPDAIAIEYQDQGLTYAELDIRARQLASYLRTLQVGPDVLVAIYMMRYPDVIVGILGILYAGGAYIPLDISYPIERIAYILEDTQASVLLTQSHLVGQLPAYKGRTLLLDTDWPIIKRAGAQQGLDDVAPEQLAYVIYTSGSTGRPKGVMIPHQGLMNYLSWCLHNYHVQRGEGAPVHSPISFDLTVTSLFAPLLVGKKLVLVSEAEGVERLQTLLARTQFSFVKLTPSHLELLRQSLSAANTIRYPQLFIVGGEALSADSVMFWREQAPMTVLVNEYGPTETVVGCCTYEVPQKAALATTIPIGRPIANVQIYVLDDQLSPVPVGVTGELYIGGAQLARGYLHRPELTAESFIPHPFSANSGARLYKTGDLARHRLDGTIEFVGRIDHQVKVRGFRVELGEIEAELRHHPAVQEVAVLLRKESSRVQRLVSYLVLTPGVSLTSSELRAFLRTRLPEYMIPSNFVALDRMPLTSNGKIAELALSSVPSRHLDVEVIYEAPRNDLERYITQVWLEVLGIGKIDVHDNFFDIGGHSILMVQVHVKLQENVNKDLTMVDLLRYTTIRSLADYLSADQPTKVDLQPTYSRANARAAALKRQQQQQRQQHIILDDQSDS